MDRSFNHRCSHLCMYGDQMQTISTRVSMLSSRPDLSQPDLFSTTLLQSFLADGSLYFVVVSCFHLFNFLMAIVRVSYHL